MTDKILLFIPAYNCERQIRRVIAQLTPDVRRLLSEVIVVDNRSRDGTQAIALEALRDLAPLRAKLLVNDENYGLGGSHKVAFARTIEGGFDYVIVLHGDDQGSIADIIPLLEQGAHREVDCLLGARFMRGSRLVGYSALRTFGNYVFNILYSLAARTALYDLGSGLNLYATRALADRNWRRNANDLTFNYYMILRSVALGWRIRYFPLSWREDGQTSNVKLFRQSMRVLRIAAEFFINRPRFLAADFSGRAEQSYPSTVVFDNAEERVG
jgi:dolichol-phosphate mannosyltransferase